MSEHPDREYAPEPWTPPDHDRWDWRDHGRGPMWWRWWWHQLSPTRPLGRQLRWLWLAAPAAVCVVATVAWMASDGNGKIVGVTLIAVLTVAAVLGSVSVPIALTIGRLLDRPPPPPKDGGEVVQLRWTEPPD